MDINQENAKYNQHAQDMCCNAQQMSAGNRAPSQAEEAENDSRHHRAKADKANLAATFFRKHPEFDEFVQLIREGVIRM